NGTAQANSTAEMPMTASADIRSQRVAGMLERKMSRSSPIVVSGKLAADAPWQYLQTRKNNPSGAVGCPAEPWNQHHWNRIPAVRLATPRRESTRGYILPR